MPRCRHARARNALATIAIRSLPLFGIPFAVKDNIDVAGLPTTAACPAFAYTPARIAHCRGAAARRPARSSSARPISTSSRPASSARARPTARRATSSIRATSPGGSSSGSAVAVARGLVRFRARHRHGRLRPRAGRVQQHRRAEADTRAARARAASCPPAARSIASRSSRYTAGDALEVMRMAACFDA